MVYCFTHITTSHRLGSDRCHAEEKSAAIAGTGNDAWWNYSTIIIGYWWYMYIHTYIDTYIHTHTYTHIHTHTHTYRHTNKHTYIHTLHCITLHYITLITLITYIHTYTYIYIHIHAYIHTCIHAYIHTYILYLYIYIYGYVYISRGTIIAILMNDMNRILQASIWGIQSILKIPICGSVWEWFTSKSLGLLWAQKWRISRIGNLSGDIVWTNTNSMIYVVVSENG